jgi:hypothetical protein
MKPGLIFFGLLLLLSIPYPTAAQQVVPAPPGGAAPYMVPAPVASLPVMAGVPMIQMPPQGYGMPFPAMPYGMAVPASGGQQQLVNWGPPPGAIPIPGSAQMPPAGAQMPPANGQMPAQYQGFAEDDVNAGADSSGNGRAPGALTPYEQQEAALRESQMMQQLEDIKQQKEMEESFRRNVLADFDNDNQSGAAGSGFNGDRNSSGGTRGKVGSALKTGWRMAAPTASYVGTFFILRAITGGY